MIKQRWQKMKKRDTAAVEALLRSRERWCTGACGRYLSRDTAHEHVWLLKNPASSAPAGGISALIIQSKRGLFPVLCGLEDIPLPRFVHGLFSGEVHSLQGISSEALTLARALEKCGLRSSEDIDYELMSLDKAPPDSASQGGPAGLMLRKPEFTDMNALAALHAAYEQEEVVSKNGVFSAAVSRLNLQRIFTNEQMLVAELNGQLVGKINTSADSFTRFQVGGVYVHPDFRAQGIARRMTAEFVRSLIAQGKGVSLFVKKSNPAALSVYRRAGFEFLADYRISYY